MKTLMALILPFIAVTFPLHAQTSPYAIGKTSFIEVSGTSTLHDWEMKTSQITGHATFEISNGILQSVTDVTISLPAESLKSGKDAMDNNAYKALRTNEHKNITFRSTKATLEKKESTYIITCDGILQMSGASHPTQLTVSCTLDGTSVKCIGEKKLKMSEFTIEPPSFMFGSVKTGDEITLNLNVTFIK